MYSFFLCRYGINRGLHQPMFYQVFLWWNKSYSCMLRECTSASPPAFVILQFESHTATPFAFAFYSFLISPVFHMNLFHGKMPLACICQKNCDLAALLMPMMSRICSKSCLNISCSIGSIGTSPTAPLRNFLVVLPLAQGTSFRDYCDCYLFAMDRS